MGPVQFYHSTIGGVIQKSRWRLVLFGKPLLAPRISRIRVAPHFPEPQDVAVQKRDFPNELGPFPGVPLRNYDPGRAAMVIVPKRYAWKGAKRSEEHTSELQSLTNIVCRLLLGKKIC